MKINVIKDAAGKVIATFPAESANGAQVKPLSKDGHKVEQLDVPENYRSKLDVVYK